MDTHKDGHSAALLDELGTVQAALEVAANRGGYRRLLSWARSQSEERTGAVEGTGSYGAGLASFLAEPLQAPEEPDMP